MLVGVPVLMPFESTASWLTRTALSQGTTVKELSKYLALERGIDPDLSISTQTANRIAELTSQPSISFAFICHILNSLKKVDRSGSEYLLFRDRQPVYRFCGPCLATQRLKSFPLHWRFKAWRWCPEHLCMLLSKCPHCSSYISLPGDMLFAGKMREGVAQLDHCLVCASPLTASWRTVRDTLDFSLLSPWELIMLKNGRAVLSALLHRRVHLNDRRETSPIKKLRSLREMGLLPHDHFHLDHSEIMLRILKREAQSEADVG